jgi:hypothetical protein
MSFEKDGKVSFEETTKMLPRERLNLIRELLSRARTLSPTEDRVDSLLLTEKVNF